MDKEKKSNKIKTIVLIIIVILLAMFPLIINKVEEFKGADDRATSAINEVNPNYKPWFNYLWNPSGEISMFFFALQGALGGGVVGYYIGYVRGKAKGKLEKE